MDVELISGIIPTQPLSNVVPLMPFGVPAISMFGADLTTARTCVGPRRGRGASLPAFFASTARASEREPTTRYQSPASASGSGWVLTAWHSATPAIAVVASASVA